MTIAARPDVLEFFDRYQRGADTSDPDLVRDCFAETFLNLDPRSAGPVPREALIQALPGRARMFASLGVEALELTELAERPLDELHTLATATWSARFTPEATDADPLELPSRFLLRRHGPSWQIVAYLSSTDLAAVVAERMGAAGELTIRRAGPDDASAVAAMVREIAAHEDQSEHVHVSDGHWAALLARPDVIVLLAEQGGRAAGYVSAVRQLHLWTGGDVLALDDLFVRPGRRDAGLGRRLMTALAAHAAPEQLLIRWGMEVDNVDAQRFYRRLGATLRPKVLAAWAPSAYAELAGESS